MTGVSKRCVTALRQGKSGLGLTPRFAYYYSYELVPRKVAQEFADLVAGHRRRQ